MLLSGKGKKANNQEDGFMMNDQELSKLKEIVDADLAYWDVKKWKVYNKHSEPCDTIAYGNDLNKDRCCCGGRHNPQSFKELIEEQHGSERATEYERWQEQKNKLLREFKERCTEREKKFMEQERNNRIDSEFLNRTYDI